jgi:hypothetical protein
VWSIALLPGRALRVEDFADAHGDDALAESVAVDGVAIPVQVARHRGIAREGLGDLLSGPLRRGMRGDVDVQDAPPIVAQDDEAVEQLEGERRHDEEVAGRGHGHVVGEERAPGLPAFRVGALDHVLRDGRLRDVVAEERELGPDARRAPEDVLHGHAADERDDLGIDGRPSGLRLGLPAPVVAKALAVPADHRLGLHEHEVLLPVLDEAVDHDPEEAVAVVEPRPLHAALEDVELLAEEDVLEGEACAVRRERAHERQQVEEEPHAGGSSTAAVGARAASASGLAWSSRYRGDLAAQRWAGGIRDAAGGCQRRVWIARCGKFHRCASAAQVPALHGLSGLHGQPAAVSPWPVRRRHFVEGLVPD